MPNETPASPADEHTQFAQEASAELTQEHQAKYEAILEKMNSGEGQSWALPVTTLQPLPDGPITPAEFRRRGASAELLAALGDDTAAACTLVAGLRDACRTNDPPAPWAEGLADRAERV